MIENKIVSRKIYALDEFILILICLSQGIAPPGEYTSTDPAPSHAMSNLALELPRLVANRNASILEQCSL